MSTPISTTHPLALLTGGGTAGHVFPALVVADELRRRGWAVSFAGAAGGIEARLAAGRDIDFHPIEARPLVGRGALGKARALWTVLLSALGARRLVRRLDARVVLGTGGYICAPAVLGARLARRPVVLLEPNGRAGVANRWLARWSNEVLVSWKSAAGDFRGVVRCIGTPVRASFFDTPPLRADRLRATTKRRLLVLGGSQGATELNQRLPPALAHVLRHLPALAVVHQCGERHTETARAAYAAAGLGDVVEVVPFIDDVATAMGDADLVVSRAGAVTLAELCAAGRPALLLPLAVALGHQKDNAAELVAAGAAELVPSQDDATALGDRVLELLRNPVELERRAAAARTLAHPDAAARIADRLEAWGAA